MPDAVDYAGERACWSGENSGREGSLEATWELAGIEECWGDSLFFGGEAGARAHYQAAQRALMPPGMMFDAGEESDRRMEAYGRLTNKLYAVGPDDRAREGNDAQAHPLFRPVVRREEAAPELSQPELPKPPKLELPKPAPPEFRAEQSGLGQLYRASDHWCHHGLGESWLNVAKELSPHHPADGRRACWWSLHFFELYAKAWEAHLPASRWDSDGGPEMIKVQSLEESLVAGGADSPQPDWVSRMLDGDWKSALAVLSGTEPEAEYKGLAKMVAEAAKAAGQDEAAQALFAWLGQGS